MRQKCKQCDGRGKVRINLAGILIDAACLDCDETGYIDVPEESADENMKVVESEESQRSRQRCKQCNGRGKVLVNIGGLLVDAACLDCDETGYVEV